jgi:hypothetical protein
MTMIFRGALSQKYYSLRMGKYIHRKIHQNCIQFKTEEIETPI